MGVCLNEDPLWKLEIFMSKRDEILSSLDDIKFLSTSTMGAMKVMKDPEASYEEIGRAIEVDPAMTTNVLRFANSAYFACSCEIHTVREAVVRLGVNKISRMLLLTSTRQFTTVENKGYGLPVGNPWDTMISSAVTTDVLANVLNIRPPNYTFTAGLLQNIGKMVLGNNLNIDPEPIHCLVENEGISFGQAEREILGVDHVEVSSVLLEKWGIPGDIVQTVRWCLEPDECPGSKVAVDLVHAANVISLMASNWLGVDRLGYRVCDSSEERLGVQEDTGDLVLGHLNDEILRLTQQA
jgi:HD-like signal output (HDOD) protein